MPKNWVTLTVVGKDADFSLHFNADHIVSVAPINAHACYVVVVGYSEVLEVPSSDDHILRAIRVAKGD